MIRNSKDFRDENLKISPQGVCLPSGSVFFLQRQQGKLETQIFSVRPPSWAGQINLDCETTSRLRFRMPWGGVVVSLVSVFHTSDCLHCYSVTCLPHVDILLFVKFCFNSFSRSKQS